MTSSAERGSSPHDGDLDELTSRVDANEQELVEVLELLVATKHLSEELNPEVEEMGLEYRETIDEIRIVLEDEGTAGLVRAVGENADTLVTLLELADATQALAEDIAPELESAALEAREPVDRLRVAFEDQDVLVLLQRLGENTDTFIELLDLLEATEDLLADIKPEIQSAGLDGRASFDRLRLLGSGFADAYEGHDADPYQTGRRLGNMLVLVDRLGDPELVDAFDSGLSAFTDEEQAPKRGLWGTLKAFRDDDVQQGFGTLIEFLRRMGSSQGSPSGEE